MNDYTIRSGDTLTTIARRFNTSAAALAQLNGIAHPNRIAAGTTLQLPGHSNVDRFDAPAGTGPLPGFDAQTGARLAATVRQVADEMPGSGHCARAVSRAIDRTLGFYPGGNGNQIDDNLARSSKFREVHIPLEQALELPGLVLSWQSSRSRAGKKYGHAAITTGDGRSSISDFVERNTTNAGRSGLRIFMPV